MINAEITKEMMIHKGDIVFGVMQRAEYEIMAAALRGNVGCIFEYPAEYDGYFEIDVFYDVLAKEGYTVVEEQSIDPEMIRIGIYWAVEQTSWRVQARIAQIKQKRRKICFEFRGGFFDFTKQEEVNDVKFQGIY